MMREVYFWNIVLNSADLTKMTSNGNYEEKSNNAIFSLDTLKYDNTEKCIKKLSLKPNDTIFDEKSQEIILIKHVTDFESSILHCKSLGGKVCLHTVRDFSYCNRRNLH